MEGEVRGRGAAVDRCSAERIREHHTQVPLTEDQYAVGEFGSDRAYEPSGETVRPRPTRRNLDYADADVSEDSIEGRCKLTGPIWDEEPELGDAIAKIHHQSAGLLRSPPSGLLVAPSRCTDRLPTSSTKST